MPKQSFDIAPDKQEKLYKCVKYLDTSVSKLVQNLIDEFLDKQEYLLPNGCTCGHCQNFNKFCYKFKSIEKTNTVCKLKINEFKK
jgi:hypothetical protein